MIVAGVLLSSAFNGVRRDARENLSARERAIIQPALNAAAGCDGWFVHVAVIESSAAASRNALTYKEPEEIVVIGGMPPSPTTWCASCRDYAPAVRRLAGRDRYETAAAVALDGFVAPVDTLLIATGETFPMRSRRVGSVLSRSGRSC